jgi:hypothetical protein
MCKSAFTLCVSLILQTFVMSVSQQNLCNSLLVYRFFLLVFTDSNIIIIIIIVIPFNTSCGCNNIHVKCWEFVNITCNSFVKGLSRCRYLGQDYVNRTAGVFVRMSQQQKDWYILYYELEFEFCLSFDPCQICLL